MAPLLEAVSQIILSEGDAYLLIEFVAGSRSDLTRLSCTKVLDSGTSTETEWRLMSVILSMSCTATISDYSSVLAVSLNVAASIITASPEPQG